MNCAVRLKRQKSGKSGNNVDSQSSRNPSRESLMPGIERTIDQNVGQSETLTLAYCVARHADMPPKRRTTDDSSLAGRNFSEVNALLERLHDAKVVTADIGEWLEGNHTHSKWVNSLKDQMKTIGYRPEPQKPRQEARCYGRI